MRMTLENLKIQLCAHLVCSTKNKLPIFDIFITKRESESSRWRTLEDPGGPWRTLHHYESLTIMDHSEAFWSTLEHLAGLRSVSAEHSGALQYYRALWRALRVFFNTCISSKWTGGVTSYPPVGLWPGFYPPVPSARGGLYLPVKLRKIAKHLVFWRKIAKNFGILVKNSQKFENFGHDWG